MVKSRKSGRPHKKRYTRKHRFSTTGKILPPLDVRSSKHLKDFETRLKKGPVTIILVYADWCGHCHTMMPHFDAASKSPGRSIQSIKVNEEMLNSVNNHINKNVNRNAKPLEVEGYPSIILVDNKGDKISDIQPVRDTSVMTKVMNESGKLSNANLGISNSGLINKASSESLNRKDNSLSPPKGNSLSEATLAVSPPKNANINEGELKGSMKPDDMLIKNEDMSKNNKSKNTNKNFDIEEAVAPSPINTFSLPSNKKEPNMNIPKDLEKKANSLVNLRGPIEPPSPESDIIGNVKIQNGGTHQKQGGSLIGTISQTAYSLAVPATLLATASYIMSDKKKSTRKNKSSRKKKSTRKHKISDKKRYSRK
jgi:thiol-disulfide isomerase/thioredoxin